MDLQTSVKLAIYDTFATTAHAPTVEDIARRLDAGIDDVQQAFNDLAEKRLLVPEPGDPSRIRMAPPFSAITTPFKVHAAGKRYDANCVWDSLGVLAALKTDGMVRTRDAHSREAMTLVVRGGSPKPTPCVIHFAVPAAHWWDDIIYT